VASKQNLDTYMTGMSCERKRVQLVECSQEGVFKNVLIKYEWDSVAENKEKNPFPGFVDGDDGVENVLW
jgi:hypothetical protein